MRYVIKSGVLYREPSFVLAKLKGVFVGPEKRVYLHDGALVLKTLIRDLGVPTERKADVRSHIYVMLDTLGNEIAVASPTMQREMTQRSWVGPSAGCEG